MVGIGHFGIGLMSKRVAPNMPLGVLLICAYFIDIVFIVFMVAGLEHLPQPDIVTMSPWSHSLLMALVWSILAGLIAMGLCRDYFTSLFIGLLVFSHWLVDFIAKPMTYIFPNDSGLLLFPGGSLVVGLGVMSSLIGVIVLEYGTLLTGIVIYIFTLKKLKESKKKVHTETTDAQSSKLGNVSPIVSASKQ
ncbi:MAG: hypothetical protein ACFFBD_23405 [Candidatus Hodarchaeota archaeon]